MRCIFAPVRHAANTSGCKASKARARNYVAEITGSLFESGAGSSHDYFFNGLYSALALLTGSRAQLRETRSHDTVVHVLRPARGALVL